MSQISINAGGGVKRGQWQAANDSDEADEEGGIELRVRAHTPKRSARIRQPSNARYVPHVHMHET